MFKNLQDKQTLPDEVTRRLESMLFGVPSSTAVYLAGLAVVPIALWWRSHDPLITAIAVISVVINVARVAIVAWFNRHDPDHRNGRPKVYWTIVLWIGCLYSVMMAALAVRALALGEALSIAISVVAVAGYVTGVVIRASAVPRLAVPHLLLVFVPMIVASACIADRAWLVAGFLLLMFCIGCLELSKTVYQRMKAQLLAEHRLSELARTDYLTGLANRASFDAQGTLQLRDARANGAGLALALIDLDGFKAVNDVHGHAAGDELLKEVSQRIRSVLRNADLAARLGGDEFAVLFDGASRPERARATGDQLVLLLKQPFEVAGAVMQISGSVGVAAVESAADSFGSIVARADQAMYRAKNAERHRQQAAVVQELVEVTEAPWLAPAATDSLALVSVPA